MGVTMMVALGVWLASSLIEYRIVSASPHLKFFFNGLPGIVISVCIGAIVGWAVGAANGAGFILGQLLGLATNQFTFSMYSNIHKMNVKKKEVVAKVDNFRNTHPSMFAQVRDTFKLGIKTIVGIFLAMIFIIGLPARIVKACAEFFHAAKAKFA